MAPRPMPGTPESLAETILMEIREDVRMMDATLRGEGGRNGLVAKVNGLLERVGRLEQSGTESGTPSAPTIRALAEAWAIRVGAGLGGALALVEAAQRLIGGAS